MTQHNLPGQLGIPVRHMGHFSSCVTQSTDHIAQCQETAVDRDSFLGSIAGGSSSLQSLGSSQVDEVELRRQRLDLAGRPGRRNVFRS